jgi:tetratricopeptide (TPR) repeat protein
MQTRVTGAGLPVLPSIRPANRDLLLQQPVNGNPVRFRGAEEAEPLAFLGKLPDDGPSPKAAKFRARAKAVLFLEPDLWRSNAGERIRLADRRAPQKQWAKGNIITGLKLLKAQVEAVNQSDDRSVAQAYLELGSTCLNLMHDKAWADKATEQDFKNKWFGVGAVAAVYPRPVHTRTEAYYRALKKMDIDFAKLGKQLYEVGISRLQKMGPDPNRPEGYYGLLSQYHQRFGETDKAVEILKDGINKLGTADEKNHLKRQLATLGQQTGRYLMALYYYDEMKSDYVAKNAGKKQKQEGDPYLGYLHHEIATVHYELGHLDKAIEQAKEATRLHGRGTVFYRADKYGATFEQFLGKLLVAKEQQPAAPKPEAKPEDPKDKV